jgi:Response regulator containing a CheY-like receiver domain and a GGDEF domain
MSETVLIVDDTPANLGVLVETLGAAGYRLMVAEDGEEALAQTEQTRPDLVLLDVMMPGIDGFETCRRLKQREATRDVPVLFMTALSETADKVKAFAAGGVDYITKPIQHEEALARVRTHLTLRRLRRELEEQLALKERFMQIAGHDLRNPLCLILMSGALARREKGVPPKVLQCLDNIADSTMQMRRIIDTFLELRGSADGGAPGRADLRLIAQAAVRQQALAAEQKGIALTCEEEEGELPLAACDGGLAYQAFANYVSNALKFTRSGGAVRVMVRVAPGGAMLRAEVADNGPGVPEGERGKLFQERGGVSVKPTGGEETHGVGLSIVKHLIESQCGIVGAEFPAGGGSVFWFEVPVSE